MFKKLIRIAQFLAMLGFAANVQAQTIATVANGMQAGTWAEVTGSNINSGALRCLQSNGCLGETSVRIVFSMHAAWDDQRGLLHYVGADHGEDLNANLAYGGNHTMAHVIYTASSNQFSLACGGGNMVSSPCGSMDSAHGYNHITVDPRTGYVYHKEYGAGLGPVIIDRFRPEVGTWETPYITYSPAYHGQDSSNWWAGTTIAGSDYGGSLLVYNCAGGSPQGELELLSPNQNSGTGNFYKILEGAQNASGGTIGVSDYQCVSVYSERYDTLFYGGGNSNLHGPGSNDDIRRLWKVGSDLVPHELPNTPIDVGVTSGNIEVDPISGNLIIIGGDGSDKTNCTAPNKIYEFDVKTSSYNLLGGSRLVPSTFPNMFTNTCANGAGYVISAPIPRYGVILYIVYSYTDSSLHMWLYKHKNPETFAERCAHAEVVACEGFDNASGIQPFDSLGGGVFRPRGMFAANSDPATYALATLDTGTKSDGASSLKFTIPAVAAHTNSTANYPYWYMNGHSDYSGQYGAGQQFYMTWRERRDTNFDTNKYAYGGGFNPGGRKQASFGQGDPNNSTFIGECTPPDIAMYDQDSKGLPGVEQGCGVNSPMNQVFYPPGCDVGGTCDGTLTLENAVTLPPCLYQSPAPGYQSPNNCQFYNLNTNKWVAYKVWVKFGPSGHSAIPGQGTCTVGLAPNDAYCGTQFKEWIQTDTDKTWRLIMSMSNLNWYSQGLTVGKFSIQVQNTHECGNDQASTCDIAQPVAYRWVDEFTVSNADVIPFATSCDSGTWTLTTQQSVNCVPYSLNGLFAKQLPNAGSGGPLNHLYSGANGTSAQIVANVMTANGGEVPFGRAGFVTPGREDVIGMELYYGLATDPMYRVSACDSCGSPTALNTYWHIPDQARGGKGNDSFVRVWDQTTNKILSWYTFGSDPNVGGQYILPHCTGTTVGTACDTGNIHSAQMTDYTTDVDYQWTSGAGSSIFNAGMAGVVRAQEMIQGSINHALLVNVICQSPTVINVFPSSASGGALPCTGVPVHGGDITHRPAAGSLWFYDYTPAQIAGMAVSAPLKTLITAASNYGGYFRDTSGDVDGPQMYVSAIEGGEPYLLQSTTNPVYAYLAANGVTCTPQGTVPPHSQCAYIVGLFDDSVIPLVNGTPASSHLHIADPCVPLGMLGLAGGCPDVPGAGMPAILIGPGGLINSGGLIGGKGLN